MSTGENNVLFIAQRTSRLLKSIGSNINKHEKGRFGTDTELGMGMDRGMAHTSVGIADGDGGNISINNDMGMGNGTGTNAGMSMGIGKSDGAIHAHDWAKRDGDCSWFQGRHTDAQITIYTPPQQGWTA
ncbi:hypothetical protein EON63_08415 [archaeon]|nr:MAG: hypothetical protein EON63_08415 [archaeon]